MSPTDHEHTWVPASKFPDLRCTLCGASHGAIQTTLGEAAAEARKVVGEAHYSGCRVRQELEKLELWLFRAPSQVLQELEAIRPGVYLIHNDAPRPRTALDDLRDSLDVERWKSEGVKINLFGPTEDGYLHVGVEDDVDAAQKKLDAAYGRNAVRVSQQGPFFALPGRPRVAGSRADS
jgi:hypothetical protein